MTQKNESPLKLYFEQHGPMRGDGCTTYRVKLSRTCTLQKLIDYILTQRRSWGCLRIKGNFLPSFEYEYGRQVCSSLTKADLRRKVAEISANGGWSRMDYYVILS